MKLAAELSNYPLPAPPPVPHLRPLRFCLLLLLQIEHILLRMMRICLSLFQVVDAQHMQSSQLINVAVMEYRWAD